MVDVLYGADRPRELNVHGPAGPYPRLFHHLSRVIEPTVKSPALELRREDEQLVPGLLSGARHPTGDQASRDRRGP
jgi:hypothetical protein